MTNVYAVIGEHRANPRRLLLLGEDGCFYSFTYSGRYTRVDSIDDWMLDAGRKQPRRSEREDARSAEPGNKTTGPYERNLASG